MINLSLLTSTVPTQWKQAYIQPVPKTPTPKQPADYRPISITPVLTCMTERIVVQRYIYPALSSPPTLQYNHQFAFRPTASTTAAIIHLLNTIVSLLSTVIVISWTFQKHLTQYDIQHYYVNWLSSTSWTMSITGWLTSSITIPTALHLEVNCPHCSTSPQASSKVQPLDQLHTLSQPETSLLPCQGTRCANMLTIRTSSSLASRLVELDNVQRWVEQNNLNLNCSKSTKIVF